MRFCLIMVCCAILAGCAFKTPEPDAYYGSVPTSYEAPIKSAFEVMLKDPESARYQFGSPVKVYGNNGLAYGGNVVFTGYAVPVMVNAKNGFGGYTGAKPYVALMNGNSVINVSPGTLDDQMLIHRVR